MKKVLIVLVIAAAGLALWMGCQKKAVDTPAVKEEVKEEAVQVPATPPEEPQEAPAEQPSE